MGCPVRSWKVVSLLAALSLLPLAPARAADAPGPRPDPAVRKQLEKAWKLLAKSKYKRAASTFEKANQRASGHCGICLLGLSQAEASLGERDKAIQTARAAVALDGPARFTAMAYNQLGVILIRPAAQAAQLAEAEASLRKAVELGDPMALFNLAVLQERQNRPDEVLTLARQYLAVDPRGAAAKSARILVCRARGDLEGGVSPASGSPAAVAIGPGSGIAPPQHVFQGVYVDYLGVYRRDTIPSGVVALDSVIDEEGCVVETRLSEASKAPELEEFALKTARSWVFQPAMYQGHPIRVSYQLVVDSRRAPQHNYSYSNNNYNNYSTAADTSQYFRTFNVRDFADIKSDPDGTYSVHSKWP